jgi:uncharacterized protein YndB with AHSA1/START domain
MTRTIQRELTFPQPREEVWQAIVNSDTLAQWMYSNNFEPRVGHRFTFQVPPNPKTKFDGITIQCEVLECDPPHQLTYAWAAGALTNTRVTFRLEPNGTGTRLFFEHAGFDFTQPYCEPAVKGLEFGYKKIFEQFQAVLKRQAAS